MSELKLVKYLGVVAIILAIQSCGINSDLMLKTPKNFEFDELDIDSSNATKDEYIIGVDDIIQFRFYTNKGLMVLDIASGSGGVSNNAAANLNRAREINYVIGADSLVKLPYIDMVNLVGMTIREAEKFLEEMYSDYYVDPFVQISVMNKRVLVFPGSGAEASVVYLTNNNTTLLEAIALAGGLAERGRASRIKLFRETAEGRKVYLIDLSTIEGLSYTDLIVQNGDYIYVEPVPEIGREILQEIAPIVSIISSVAVVITVVNLVNNGG